jgi:glycosyltransferase involved in cell wall biosynthesis
MSKTHSDHPFKILQISTTDNHGGAARIAWTLHQGFKKKGLNAWMAVGHKLSDDPNVFSISNDELRNQWARLWLSVGNLLLPFRGKILGAGMLKSWLQWIGQPRRLLNVLCGHEDFDFPGTQKILDLVSDKPDIAHLHNLHSDYFDLRFLAILSNCLPVVITLHDMWLLTGHCAYSMDCKKWMSGCGSCPYLKIYPGIRRDGTTYNFKKRESIYSNSSLYIVAPSKWLIQEAEQSSLASAALKKKVIHNGIDLTTFHPRDKSQARYDLHLSTSTYILLFVAEGMQANIYKDYETIRAAIEIVARKATKKRITFLALGKDGPVQEIGNVKISSIPFQNDPRLVATYYQAADIYLHAARADTFPNVVLEALACGTPVIATAIGGIPEQIVDGKTGFLTQPGNAADMAEKIIQLLKNDDLLYKMGIAAGKYARVHFSADRMVTDYLNFYQEILNEWGSRHSAPLLS